MSRHAGKSGRRVVRFCILMILLCATSSFAQSIAVLPSRIVLDGRTRSATAFVTNRGHTEGTFRVSLVYMSMDEEGRLFRADSLASSAENFAERVLRYSPRRMVIPAGGSQTLRLLVRRPPDLQTEDFEFRAHLAIRSVPDVPYLHEMDETYPMGNDDVIIARAQVSVETLIPVIVRLGRLDAEIQLLDAHMLPSSTDSNLRMIIGRRGNRSIYGDMIVDYYSPGGQRKNLITSRGVAIYTEIDRRILDIDLSLYDDVDPLRGHVVLDYRETVKGLGNLVLHERISLEDLRRR